MLCVKTSSSLVECFFHAVEEVDTRWKSIRQQRAHAEVELQKMNKSGLAGGGFSKSKYAKDPHSWYLYEHMHFLRGHVSACL